MSDPTIAAWSREGDLLFQLRQLREENERLKEDQQGVDAVDTLTEEGWVWDGDQWQRPALQSAWLLESTQTLAKTLARDFYPEVTQWECLDDLAGVISQIDNMTTGLMRKPKKESTGCACQWNFEGDRVVTCARHEGWLEVIVEWADRARDAEKKLKSIAQLEPFKPDWNTEAVLVEEMQRMAKRIEELEAMLTAQTARIVDLQTQIENLEGEEG